MTAWVITFYNQGNTAHNSIIQYNYFSSVTVAIAIEQYIGYIIYLSIHSSHLYTITIHSSLTLIRKIIFQYNTVVNSDSVFHSLPVTNLEYIIKVRSFYEFAHFF